VETPLVDFGKGTKPKMKDYVGDRRAQR